MKDGCRKKDWDKDNFTRYFGTKFVFIKTLNINFLIKRMLRKRNERRKKRSHWKDWGGRMWHKMWFSCPCGGDQTEGRMKRDKVVGSQCRGEGWGVVFDITYCSFSFLRLGNTAIAYRAILIFWASQNDMQVFHVFMLHFHLILYLKNLSLIQLF